MSGHNMSSKWVSRPLVNHPGAENVENGVPTWAPTWGERIDFFDLKTVLAPSWGHLAPQEAPRPSKKPSWGHLGTILVPCWCQVGWKNVPTWLQNSLVKSIGLVSKPTARWRLVGAAGGYYYITTLYSDYIVNFYMMTF